MEVRDTKQVLVRYANSWGIVYFVSLLALIRLANAGSCPSRQRDCVAEPIRLANAAAPLLLRSQARRKAYRARSAETKGTAQLPYGSGKTKGAVIAAG